MYWRLRVPGSLLPFPLVKSGNYRLPDFLFFFELPLDFSASVCNIIKKRYSSSWASEVRGDALGCL